VSFVKKGGKTRKPSTNKPQKSRLPAKSKKSLFRRGKIAAGNPIGWEGDGTSIDQGGHSHHEV